MVSWIRLVSESGFEQKELKISAEIDICDYGRMWFSWIQRHRPEVVICVCIGDHGDGLDLRLRGRAYGCTGEESLNFFRSMVRLSQT